MKVKVIAQISTADSKDGNANSMNKAALSVRDSVNGYWINVQINAIDGVDDFIEFLEIMI